MKNLTVAVMFMLLLGTVNLASALSLQVQPSNQTAFLNDHLVYSINVSEASGLGAYDITLSFDPFLFAEPTISYGSELGAPGDSFTDALFETGSINVAETSFLFDLSLQPTQFTLFTLDFLAIGVGTGTIAFGPVLISDLSGNYFQDVTLSGAGITIEAGQAPIPEPGTIILLSAGLAGLIFWRRRGYN